MNQEYEFDMLPENDTESTPVQEKRPVFVPREPDPSTWKVEGVRFLVTRGEQLFIHIMAGFLGVLLVLSVIFYAATAQGWTSPASDDPKEQSTSDDEGKNSKPPKPSMNFPDTTNHPYADGAKGDVLYGLSSDLKDVNVSSLPISHTALASVGEGKIIAGSGVDEQVYPASLTKVMTLIVAVESLKTEEALQDKITVSQEVYDAMKAAGASGMGMQPGETLTVEAMLYALMLKSDGIAACELARYISGSEADFVGLMNAKASAMGLTGTQFMNPTGLHHENHYSTCRDLATIMGYAMEMSLCRKVMTTNAFDAECTRVGNTSFDYHIYHNLLETYFKNTYKNLNPATAGKLTVIAGKTGYTPESKYCLVTAATDASGRMYVCVTVGADSYESSIKAYQSIYGGYVG